MKKLVMILMFGALLFALISCDSSEPLDTDTAADDDSPSSWVKTFGTATGDEQGNCVIQTSDGGYIACGITSGLAVDSLEEDVVTGAKNNVYVVKTNADGERLWEKALGGYADDHGNVIIETSDSGFLVVGEKTVFGHYGVYIIKLDASGNKLWEKTYGEAGKDDWGFGVTEAPDGGFVIVGMVGIGVSYNEQASGLWFKIDSTGNMLWKKTLKYNVNQHMHFNSIVPTSDDGFIICGSSSERYWDTDFFYIVKIASDGNIEWERPIQYKNSYSYSWVARQTPDGGYIVSGGASGWGYYGSFAVVVAKLSPSGNIQWIHHYGGDFNGWADEGAYIDFTDDGGYIVASRHGAMSFGAYSSMIYLLKIDAQGTKVWSKKYRLHQHTFANWVRTADDGGFIITGGTGNYMFSMFMMKTDSEGNVEGLEAVTEPEEDRVVEPVKHDRKKGKRRLHR